MEPVNPDSRPSIDGVLDLASRYSMHDSIYAFHNPIFEVVNLFEPREIPDLAAIAQRTYDIVYRELEDHEIATKSAQHAMVMRDYWPKAARLMHRHLDTGEDTAYEDACQRIYIAFLGLETGERKSKKEIVALTKIKEIYVDRAISGSREAIKNNQDLCEALNELWDKATSLASS
ncbi:hypothetical protein ACFL1B_04820 [Nanoarchaeota archaeon]